MKYRFRKIKATVSKNKIIRHDNQDYYLTAGAELFSRHISTRVQISPYNDKLFIFENGENGILIAEALAREPFEKTLNVEPDELDTIIVFLGKNSMVIARPTLIKAYQKGISLPVAKQIFNHNQKRYAAYIEKMRQPDDRKGTGVCQAACPAVNSLRLDIRQLRRF